MLNAVLRNLKSQKGAVFLTTIVVMFLMVLVGGAAFQLASQQLHYIRALQKSTQAQYLAEAGLADAIATLSANFSNKNDAMKFPPTALGNGHYDVTVVQNGGRVLLQSIGTVGSIQRVASLEVEDLTPTALNYTQAGGGHIVLATYTGSDSDVTGDLFANRNVILVAVAASTTVSGNVYAGDTASKIEALGGTVTWTSGTSNAGNITFPHYDFNYYKAIAQANGQYYATSQSWTNQTFNLNSSGGVLFVDGNVRFYGTNSVTGCLITTDSIRVYGTLNQQKASAYQTYPALIASENILLINGPYFGVTNPKLSANGLVYAGNNFILAGVMAKADITGSVIAKGLFHQSQFQNADLDIVYAHESPPGLVTAGGNAPVHVKSYNT